MLFQIGERTGGQLGVATGSSSFAGVRQAIGFAYAHEIRRTHNASRSSSSRRIPIVVSRPTFEGILSLMESLTRVNRRTSPVVCLRHPISFRIMRYCEYMTIILNCHVFARCFGSPRTTWEARMAPRTQIVVLGVHGHQFDESWMRRSRCYPATASCGVPG
jgi:hypothetical protein